MALKDKIPFGISLPHRSPDPNRDVDGARGCKRAERARVPRPVGDREQARSRHLLDPMVILTYAAAVTTRIRVGFAVVVLPIHIPL